MKSLEIVNRNIKAIKKLLYKLKDVQEGTKEDFEKYYHEQELKDFKIIKQDLEVLEIIYKKRIAMEYLWFLYDYYKDFTNGINYMLEKINEHQDETRKLTMEELLKLKQWLEENENDR